MEKNQYSDLYLDQIKDLVWVVDNNLDLVFANRAYLNLMKVVTGVEKELNTPVLVEGFGEGYVDKWKAYYCKALSGESFEIEEHFYNPETQEMQYGHIAFSPIRDESGEILNVACRSTDISPVMRQKDHASRLLDASLDVFCTIDEAGKFVFVSAASADHWGFRPEELIGQPFRNLIVAEDLEKTDLVAAEILAGKEFKTFSNRYLKKNGDVAYNLWSARWDHDSKLMYCVARDAKEKIEEEAEKELLSQISRSFNDEDELIPAANRLCENLYAFGKFDLIELWCPNLEQTQIKRMGHSNHNQDFYELEFSETSFQKNEGLPGKVWNKRKQLFWDEKQINKYFVRNKEASLLGLQAVLGIPLTCNDELAGVLLVGTKREADYLEQHSPVLSRLEKFIGSEINRKRLEDDLKHLYQAIPDILCIADFNGRFLKINPAGCELLGYKEEEILFHSFIEFVHPEDKEDSTKEVKKLETGATTFQFENRYLTKEGKIIWLSWNCNSSIQEGLIYASAKDITAMVQLRELNTQAGTLAKIGSWEIDLEKNTVFWSKIVHQLLETDPDSFIPDLDTAIDFYREDFRSLVRGGIDKSITTGEGFDFEAVIITKKLKERWVRAIGNVETVRGNVKRIYGSFQDITDRKESELRLQSLTDDLPGVTFQYYLYPDGTDRLFTVSKGSQHIWGLSPQQCEADINLVWEQIRKGGDFDQVVQDITHSIQTKTQWHSKWRNVLPDGSVRWHEGFGTPYFHPDGTIIYNSMVFDNTDEKLALDLYQQVLAERATILESISDAFYAVDSNWNFTYFNREAEHLLKKSAEEVLGGNIWEIFSPAKGTFLEEVYRRVVASGQSENFEYHYPGDGCWYEVTTYPSAGGVASYFKNIDERRKAAEELEKAFKEKIEILESIGDAFYAVDEDWTVTYWNKQAESVVGKKKEDVLGKNLWEEFPDAIDTVFYRQFNRAMETGETINFEEYYATLDMWIEVAVYPSDRGLSIYFKDITLRKKADIRLLEANERFEIITRATNDAIWDWDIFNNTLYWGDGFKSLFGYEVDKITPTLESWTSHIHPDDHNRVEKSVFEAIENKDVNIWQEEYRYERADGTFAFVYDKGMILRNQKGKAIRMLGAMSDFTQLKKQEAELLKINESLKNYAKELERSNEELEQFAFITSHDLQEPLRMISSFIDLLKRKYADQLDDKAHQYIHYATDGAKRMKQIILDLLLYSRANKPSEQLEEINLNKIVSEFTQLRRKLIAEKKAAITFDGLPVLQTFRAPITQIIHCLLDNAIKYVKENVPPRIEIQAKEKERFWEFSIKDNGIGIEEMFYDKIFVIFQRLHNRNQHDGTGIGLSIAKRSVEYLGGEIWLESKVGEGTTFYFTISKYK